MASRAQVAALMADRLKSDRHKTIREAAAWLVQTGRARDARYLARDVASVLADRGYLLVQVTTARPLTEKAKSELEHFIKSQTDAKTLELQTNVDPEIVGGVNIETPRATLDATVRTKLTRYVEGVQRD